MLEETFLHIIIFEETFVSCEKNIFNYTLWYLQSHTSYTSSLQSRSSIAARTAALSTKCQLTNLVMLIKRSLLLGNLRRGNGVAWWYIHTRVVDEEISRSQEKSHGLNGHDREVLRCRDVCDTECVPHNNICVLSAGCSIGDPLGKTLGGFTGCLRDVATCGPELVVAVCDVLVKILMMPSGDELTRSDVHSMSSETSTLPNK